MLYALLPLFDHRHPISNQFIYELIYIWNFDYFIFFEFKLLHNEICLNKYIESQIYFPMWMRKFRCEIKWEFFTIRIQIFIAQYAKNTFNDSYFLMKQKKNESKCRKSIGLFRNETSRTTLKIYHFGKVWFSLMTVCIQTDMIIWTQCSFIIFPIISHSNTWSFTVCIKRV